MFNKWLLKIQLKYGFQVKAPEQGAQIPPIRRTEEQKWEHKEQ